MIKQIIIIVCSLILCANSFAQQKSIEEKVNALMSKMNLEEKVGQMNQYSSTEELTGPKMASPDLLKEIRAGRLGSVLNIRGVKQTRQLQEAAMQTRLKIPLLFAHDVIHGYRVTFPIPLAEAASWDLDAIELSARIAGKEAAAAGLHWTFAPMVDICRDPRWGRVMEGAGEDPYLGSLIAKARVKGFQGKGFGSTDAVMACAKHFAAYGAAIGGRDYNSVDISGRMLWETYLPPFKAAADAGVATFMNSFNDLNGVPASASTYLQRDILKGKWNFKGFVVSDWGSIGEMIQHGYVKDNYEAAEAAVKAGSDMDMESRSYINNLVQLVKDKKVPESVIDEAVKRILTLKFKMGLFDDPFRYCDEKREAATLNTPEHQAAALRMAEKSMVLLKNENQLLPLNKEYKTIALIGPMAKSNADMKGFWALDWGKEDNLVSLYDGMQHKVGNTTQLLYSKGCDITDTSRAQFTEAVATAQKAEVIIMAIGEAHDMSGEAKSRANIHLPGVQEELVKAIQATGKPLIVLIMAGRPLIFNWTADNANAILYTWWLGSQAGNAMANVLYGDYNPSGKLPITFPRFEGQIPLYYNYLNTGRPAQNEDITFYRSGYIDTPNSPRYHFGYGLSYTQFKYENLKLSDTVMNKNGSIKVSLLLTNTGKFAGEEVAQLYLRDYVASLVRPVKELKDFKKVYLHPGETKTIEFTIDKEKLSFYNARLLWDCEPGTFKLMIGSSSKDIRLEGDFELMGSR
ncbi:beta-glucosidase BglX [Chitinophagaceae bacterium LB-8]|uniref:Beta-glucosidase BglX n=1 Tax=Paraflavisolibacter caeni TaxID=2982496 RepID=A0A9X2XZ17_9BACT|nr:beta-glucosidase BglX [Paraflavisolibacter caeni]MCU7551500.1 beta-glucosidase BglX [Paraflavisolibacter caeni]